VEYFCAAKPQNRNLKTVQHAKRAMLQRLVIALFAFDFVFTFHLLFTLYSLLFTFYFLLFTLKFTIPFQLQKLANVKKALNAN
jgi:hypothetical protein